MRKNKIFKIFIIALVIICIRYGFNNSSISKYEDNAAVSLDNISSSFSNLYKKYSKLATKVDNYLFDAEDAVSEPLQKVSLAKVVDGDTIRVINTNNIEFKVRLIGLDTPESVHSDKSKNNEYGELASIHTKEILNDIDYVYLEYDENKEDRYGRTLAYVWLNEDTSDIHNMLNYKILNDGYAIDKEYKPNIRYSKAFKDAVIDAKTNQIGLWDKQGFIELWD